MTKWPSGLSANLIIRELLFGEDSAWERLHHVQPL